MCNSGEQGKKAIIHMVSAWSNENSMVLGQLKDAFAHGSIEQVDEQRNLGHGRIEKRTCPIITAIKWVCKVQDCQGLQILIEIKSMRTIKATGVKQIQTRHYISSALSTAKRFNEGH